MKTRPTATHRHGKVMLWNLASKKVAEMDGEQAIKLGHNLIGVGEKALKRAGKWKPA